MPLLHSTWLYITLPLLYLTCLHSILLYHDSTMLLYHGSTLFYSTLHSSTMPLLHSTWLYIMVPLFYFILLNSTLFYHGSSRLKHSNVNSNHSKVIPFYWLEFAFKYCESLSNGWNLHLNASNPFQMVRIWIRIPFY